VQYPDYLFSELLPPLRPDVPMEWRSFEAMEREALAAARQGSFKLLAYLLDPEPTWVHGVDAASPQAIPNRLQRLSQESEVLIARRLRGEFKADRQGAPKQPVARRRARTPVYAAADEIATIQGILSQHYPNERGIRDRAITIAAARAGITPKRLRNHLRSKRRLKSPRRALKSD
jgi:hypothetical protein